MPPLGLIFGHFLFAALWRCQRAIGSGQYNLAQNPGLLCSRNVYFSVSFVASGGPAKTLYFRCFVGQLVILQRTGWNCTICGLLLVLAIMISVEQLMSLQPNYRIFLLVNNICANIIDLHIFLGVFFEQGSRPRMWANTPWAICRTDRLSTIDYNIAKARMSLQCHYT